MDLNATDLVNSTTLLRSAFEEVRLACQDNDDGVAVIAAVENLLKTACISSSDCCGSKSTEPSLYREIAIFVRNTGMQHIDVRNVLIQHIMRLPDPLPFIEIVPTLFSVAVASDVVEKVAKHLQLLLQQDTKLLLPVIGALVELPLPRNEALQLTRLAEIAMTMADEADLPMLIRTLLKSLAVLPEKHMVQSIRREVCSLSEDVLALVVEAMWESLPGSTRAGFAYLESVTAEAVPGMGIRKEPTLSDVTVVLILSAELGPLRSRARAVLSTWLQLQVFPFHLMERLVHLRCTNDIWDRMIPGIWCATMWLLTELAYSNKSALAGHNLTKNAIAHQGLERLVLCLYASVPFMQEPILSSLLGQCFASCTNERQELSPSVGPGANVVRRHHDEVLLPLPKLGFCTLHNGMVCDIEGNPLRKHYNVKGSASIKYLSSRSDNISLCLNGSEKRIKLQRRAALAAKLLNTLVSTHPEAGMVVLSTLIHHLQPESDGRVLLPVPAVLHHLISCIAAASAVSPQVESTLLITAQKLIASVASPFSELVSLLGTNDVSSVPTNSIGLSYSCGQQAYTQRAVGLLLAGHFLRRYAAGGRHPQLQDKRAVLAWVGQSMAGPPDDCIVYALDIFASCLTVPLHAYSDHQEFSSYGRGVEAERVQTLVDGCLTRLMRSLQICFTITQDREKVVPVHAKPNGNITPLQQCFISAPVMVNNTPISEVRTEQADTAQSVVWSVSRLAAALVAINLEASAVANIASTAFWTVQRMATVCPIRDVALILSTHPSLELALETPSRLGPRSVGDCELPSASAQQLWTWVHSGDFDAFQSMQKRALDIPAVVALQLAWERALVVAILLGQSQALCRETPGVKSSALQLVSRILAQLDASRYMLRLAQAASNQISMGGMTGGLRGRYLGHLLRKRVSKHDENLCLVAALQRLALQRLLDRCTVMLGLPLLVNAWEELNSNNAGIEPLPQFLTSTGFAIVSAFSLQCLVRQQSPSFKVALTGRTSSILSGAKPFFSINSFSSSFSSALPTSSSTAASILSNGALDPGSSCAPLPLPLEPADSFVLFDEMLLQHDESLDFKKEMILVQILAWAPELAKLTEQRRVQVLSQNTGHSKNEILGPELDRRGCSLMLLVVYFLLETNIQVAQAACAGDVIEFALNPLFNRVAIALAPEEQEINAFDTRKNAKVDDIASNVSDADGARRMVILYSAIETSVRSLQDSTLAAAGLQTLATLTRGTRLALRVARLAWELLGALYTVHTDLSLGLLRGLRGEKSKGETNVSASAALRAVGMDALWPFLAAHMAQQPFARDAFAEMAQFGRVGNAAALLIRGAFAPTTGTFTATTHSLRRIAATWWIHEPIQKRLGGLACLLFQTLGGVFSPGQPLVWYSFPGLTEFTAEQHAQTALALLPAQLLLSQSTEGSADPYSAQVGAARMFVWAMRELQAISDEGDAAGLHQRLVPLIVRICRVQLEAAEVAVANAIRWRSAQPHRSSIGSSGVTDSGAVGHLRHLLQWLFAVSQWVLRFVHGVQLRYLATKADSFVHRGLARSVPIISLQAERTASRMHRLARSHGLESLVEPDISERMWEDSLREIASAFCRAHDVALQTSMSSSENWVAAISHPTECVSDVGIVGRAEHDNLVPECDAGERLDSDALLEPDDEYAYFVSGLGQTSFNSNMNESQTQGWGIYTSSNEHEDEDMNFEPELLFEDGSVESLSVPGGGKRSIKQQNGRREVRTRN